MICSLTVIGRTHNLTHNKSDTATGEAPNSLPITPARPWKIDDDLNRLLHRPVRVAAEAFAPIGDKSASTRLVRTSNFILPDNTKADGLPVFFEGVLVEATRRVGVVQVRLGRPIESQPSAEGCLVFRGRTAVIVRGPAIVRLAFPFQVELLPLNAHNYWQDLQLPQAQFVFTFAEGDRHQSI